MSGRRNRGLLGSAGARLVRLLTPAEAERRRAEQPPAEPRELAAPTRRAVVDPAPSPVDEHVEALREAERLRDRAERSARLHHRVTASLVRHLGDTVEVLLHGDPARRRSQAEAMRRRLADLEELAAIEADRLEIEPRPFAPRRLADQLLARHADAAMARGLTLAQRCDEALPATLVGDPKRLGRVIEHLLENAVEANADGLVRLILEAVNPGGDGGDRLRLRVTVVDDGLGLSRERIAVLTEPGAGGEAPDEDAVGLFFARALTEAMGGCLGVESSARRGSRFWLEIPVEAAEGELEEASEPAAAPRTVLVAEDEEATQFIVRALLEQLDCRVVTAEGGREAVERVAEHRPELVLMDLQMPEMDGFEAARRIIARGEPLPRIVAMSATDDPREEARALAVGMERFLVKPLTLERLRNLLGRDAPSATPAAAPSATSVVDGEGALIFNPERLTDMIFDLSAMWIDKVTRTGAVSISESSDLLSAMDADGDLEALRAAAHKLKGAAGNNGLDRLRALTAELERAAKEGDREAVARLLPEVDPLAEESLEALAAWKNNPRGG